MPTEAEKIAFIDAVSDELKNDASVEKFLDNVKQAGVAANTVDASFDRVSRAFDDMVNKYGSDFPGFSDYNDQWKSYNKASSSATGPTSTLSFSHSAG